MYVATRCFADTQYTKMAAIDVDDATTASLDPAEHDAIDVSKVPALVSWVGEDGRSRELRRSARDHLTVDIKFDAEAHTAFFKITANLALKTNTRSPTRSCSSIQSAFNR